MSHTIGIISGSGPEAGLDLCSKVLQARREELGSAYRGDIDAPQMVMISEPVLGWSMDLAGHHEEVWDALAATVKRLAPLVDVYGIACNTLNVYAEQLDALGLSAQLISMQDAARGLVAARGLERVGLLAAGPVSSLGEHSAYTPLLDVVDLVVPDATDELHQLIHDVKLRGEGTPEHGAVLEAIVRSMDVEVTLLACTELPLIPCSPEGTELIDVTELLATALVDHTR